MISICLCVEKNHTIGGLELNTNNGLRIVLKHLQATFICLLRAFKCLQATITCLRRVFKCLDVTIICLRRVFKCLQTTFKCLRRALRCLEVTIKCLWRAFKCLRFTITCLWRALRCCEAAMNIFSRCVGNKTMEHKKSPWITPWASSRRSIKRLSSLPNAGCVIFWYHQPSGTRWSLCRIWQLPRRAFARKIR